MSYSVGMAKPCECGCGLPAPLAKQSDTRRGYVKGRPHMYISGHGGHDKLRKPLAGLYVVQDCGYSTPCWVWQGGTNGAGYGRTKWRGRMRPAHHAYLALAGINIPEGMQPDHLCHNPPCVNPDHFEIVTPLENQHRKRNLKLNHAAVREIRDARRRALAASPLTDEGKPRQRVPGGRALREELGARYGVCADYIKTIWRGDAWAA